MTTDINSSYQENILLNKEIEKTVAIDLFRTLNSIFTICQIQEFEEILNQASRCIKDILDCRMVAFVLQENDTGDISINPICYSIHMNKLIQRDFNFHSSVVFQCLDKKSHKIVPLIFNSDNLNSYLMMNEMYTARLYVLPKINMTPHDKEIMDLIVKATSISLSNFIRSKKLENAAATDPLTHCYNRREFEVQIERDIADAHRYHRKFSLLMFDIDCFKEINDTYGHPAGDKVLKKIVGIIRQNIRQGNYIGRYGGDEFFVALPETNTSQARELAERLCKLIADAKIKLDEETSICITASFGVTSLCKNTNLPELLEKVDRMLYQAKSKGRNTVN